MGTGKVGLCTMNIATGEIKEMPLNKKLPGYVYQAIFYDSEGTLWIGTYNQGLIKANPGSPDFHQFVNDPLNSGSLPGNDVRTVFEGRDKTIWVGTNSGLAKYDKKNNCFIRIDIGEGRKIAIRTIKEDSDGLLWLGTYGDRVITYNTDREEAI